ncbi:MAG: hypothetical protein WAK20_12055 [Candidatus Acidiferrum sp.]
MKRAATLTVVAVFFGTFCAVAPSGRSRLSIVPKVHAAEGCSLETLKGTYGFHRAGTVPGGPLAAVGYTIFDGHGGSSTFQTIRNDGLTTEDLFTDGSYDAFYSVDRNCTGKFINPDQSVFGHAVIVGQGEEVYFMSLSDHNTIAGVMKRISPRWEQ